MNLFRMDERNGSRRDGSRRGGSVGRRAGGLRSGALSEQAGARKSRGGALVECRIDQPLAGWLGLNGVATITPSGQAAPDRLQWTWEAVSGAVLARTANIRFQPPKLAEPWSVEPAQLLENAASSPIPPTWDSRPARINSIPLPREPAAAATESSRTR